MCSSDLFAIAVQQFGINVKASFCGEGAWLLKTLALVLNLILLLDSYPSTTATVAQPAPCFC